MRIFLTGFMGAGKTYVGRRLAELLDLPFVDLDAQIVDVTGLSINEIFARHGEAAFREMEATALREFAADDAFVMSTGGGAPCFHGNADWMNERGTTVFLAPSLDILVARLEAGRAERPLLQSAAELREFIETKLAARRHFYEKAHIHVRYTDAETDVARLLFRQLSAQN